MFASVPAATHNAPNPILVEFRNLWKGQPDMLEMAEQWSIYELDGDWESRWTWEASVAQITHARHVLARLAQVVT